MSNVVIIRELAAAWDEPPRPSKASGGRLPPVFSSSNEGVIRNRGFPSRTFGGSKAMASAVLQMCKVYVSTLDRSECLFGESSHAKPEYAVVQAHCSIASDSMGFNTCHPRAPILMAKLQ